jgi:hypothetical protein
MFRIRAIQFKFCLQRNAVGQSPLDAFFDAVTWRVNKIIKKLQYKVVSRVGDREILCENFVKTFIDTILRVCLKLEKILECPYLNIQKIRIFILDLCGSETDPVDFV